MGRRGLKRKDRVPRQPRATCGCLLLQATLTRAFSGVLSDCCNKPAKQARLAFFLFTNEEKQARVVTPWQSILLVGVKLWVPSISLHKLGMTAHAYNPST